jgi:hypothetical protein
LPSGPAAFVHRLTFRPAASLALLAALWLGGSALRALGQGGPPMLTDDPGTPGDGHWEINVAYIPEESRDGSRSANGPLLDMNYGVGDRVQLKYQVPWLIAADPGRPSQAGLGDSQVGVKWRFYDDPAAELAISTYPQLTFNNPTSSVQRGLVESDTALLLPFEFQGKLGPLDWNAEVGREFHARSEDLWIYGLALGREVNSRLELAVELHGTGRFARNEDQLIANLGARIKLTEHETLLVSAGRSVNRTHGTELTFTGYLGVQWTH